MPAAVFVIAAFWPGADHIPEAIGFRISTARLLPQALCFKLRVRQRSCFFHASGRKAIGMYSIGGTASRRGWVQKPSR